MRWRVLITILCMAVVGASCGSEPLATTEPMDDTTTSSSTSTTSATTTHTTSAREQSTRSPVNDGPTGPTAPTLTPEPSTSTLDPTGLVFVPPDPFVAPPPTPTGGGSGCGPGQGPLPDGVWFGYLDGLEQAQITFDLACFVSCDPGEGHRITNARPDTRAVPVHPGATIVFGYPDGTRWVDPYADAWSYEGLGFHDEVWIYVNAGTVTGIVFNTQAAGCRHAVASIDWIAELPMAGPVAFNDLGLTVALLDDSGRSQFLWRDDWARVDRLSGQPQRYLADAFTNAASAAHHTVAIGSMVHRWNGTSWTTDSFASLDETVSALAVSDTHVLMASWSGDGVAVHVITPISDGWDVATIPLGRLDEWESWAGAIGTNTFAISDTGMDTGARTGRGTVRVYDWNGSSWVLTSTLKKDSRWKVGNWGSSLDLDGDDVLLVGADGATPGPGTNGGVYLYTRTGDTWTPEVIGEGRGGFGYGARIDGGIIVVSAGSDDPATTFWVFTPADTSWLGTPIAVDGDTEAWVQGLDIDDGLVAVATGQGTWIGAIRASP